VATTTDAGGVDESPEAAPGNGKCQEMLSLRMVVVPGARWRFTSAISMVRPTSSRTVSGRVLTTDTRAFGGIRYVSGSF